MNMILPYAFVDGSYNPTTKIYGYGGFIRTSDDIRIIHGYSDNKEMASMRNVAGEIEGATKAIEKAIELGFPKLTIYYDYLGIEMWATGLWKRNLYGTKEYYKFVQESLEHIELEFVHVKGHSGIEGNELADHIAKDAVTILPSLEDDSDVEKLAMEYLTYINENHLFMDK